MWWIILFHVGWLLAILLFTYKCNPTEFQITEATLATWYEATILNQHFKK
jgi:hypothetical protein